MKDLAHIISERNEIATSFPSPIEFTKLLSTDITDHLYWLRRAYVGKPREGNVVRKCGRRFSAEYNRN